MKTENSGLGRVEDGGRENGTVDATVGDGEDAAFEVGQSQFSFAGTGSDGAEGFFEAREIELVAIAKNGDDEAAFGADGDADIKVVLGDDFIAFDAGVDGGNRFEGVDGGLEKEAHEAEFDAVLGLEGGLNFGAKGDEIGEVGFVEGGEDSGGVLGTDESIGDFAAEGGHLFASLAVGAWRGVGGHGGIRLGVNQGRGWGRGDYAGWG